LNFNDASIEAGGNFTPEVFGIYSNTFADDTFGIALTAIYQERDTGVDNANVMGWNTLQGSGQLPGPGKTH
jgi:hypothetical protein